MALYTKNCVNYFMDKFIRLSPSVQSLDVMKILPGISNGRIHI